MVDTNKIQREAIEDTKRVKEFHKRQSLKKLVERLKEQNDSNKVKIDFSRIKTKQD